MAGEQKQVKVKITDDVLMGRYANFMKVTHTSGEFVLEFANVVPPMGAVVAKIFVSPGHLRRIIKTLGVNVEKYEKKFGKIKEAEEPEKEIGF